MADNYRGAPAALLAQLDEVITVQLAEMKEMTASENGFGETVSAQAEQLKALCAARAMLVHPDLVLTGTNKQQR